MNYILMIQTFLAAIKTVEMLMPPETKGKEKFDAAIAVTEGVVGSVQSMLPALQFLATTAVGAYRALGTFKR